MPSRLTLAAACGICLLMCSAAPAAEGESEVTRPQAAEPAPPSAPAEAAVPPKPSDAAAQPTPSGEPADAPPVDRPKRIKRTLFPAPLENETGKEEYDPVAAGLGDMVAALLARQEHVTLVERQRLEALTKEQALSLKGLTGRNYAVGAGKLLKADTVLTGRLFVVERKLTVSVQVLEIATARVAAAEQLSCRPEDVMETALQVARKLAEQMAMPLPEIALKEIDQSPLAGLHFAKALSHYYAGDLDAAIMQLMRTIDLDPDYTEAHYWAGMCYHRLAEWPHAVIEWERYQERCPRGRYAGAVAQLLAEAKARDVETRGAHQRLGPEPETEKPAG